MTDLATTLSDIALRDNFVQQAQALIPPPPPTTALQAAKRAHDGLPRREREIAETLVLGIRTVEGHVSNILGKLGFTSRTEIVVWAVERGLREGECGDDYCLFSNTCFRIRVDNRINFSQYLAQIRRFGLDY